MTSKRKRYIVKIISKLIPWYLYNVCLLFDNPYNQIIRVPNKRKIKFSIDLESSSIIDKIEPKPNIRQKLMIHDPIIFPSAMLWFPFIIATIEVTSSGREVPNATIVSPITFVGTFKIEEISIEDSTTKSPPYFKEKPPSIINNKLFITE